MRKIIFIWLSSLYNPSNTGNAPANTGSLPPNTANSGTPGGSVNDQNAFNNTDNVSTLLQIVE